MNYAKRLLQAATAIQEAAKSMGMTQTAATDKVVDSLVAKPVVEMDEDDIIFTQELLISWKKRLRILKKKEATYGLDCPPQVITEIADIDKTVDELERKLKAVNAL